jgi:hypothetical protein
MVSTPRTNPYVRTDGWDEEVAKINARKAACLRSTTSRPPEQEDNMATMRTPIESGVPDNKQYLHPTAAEELRQLEVPRPAPAGRAAPRLAQRRRGLDGARRHAAPDGRVHHPQAVRHRRHLRRRPCALHHPQQHRVHGVRPEQGGAADRRWRRATASRSAAPATRCP